MQAPQISTIAPGQPFARVLAQHLMAQYGVGEGLSQVLLLLPNRRACLSMREAFLEANQGKPLLLPRIQPLADMDTDVWMAQALYAAPEQEAEALPPAMPRLKRLLMLARLVHAFISRRGQERVSATMEHAMLLAEALASLLDECSQQRVDPAQLRALVSERELAKHWEISVDFLEIILSRWPQMEKETGSISAAAWQDTMLSLLTQHWHQHPPAHPVVAAGTTGSIPATAALLRVIAQLPNSEVIVPGLDCGMEEKIWQVLPPTHPQYMLKELLLHLETPRDRVRILGEELRSARQQLLRMVMLPPEYSDQWAALAQETMTEGMQDVACVECATQAQEAAVITLKLREVLDTPGRRAMLVTPDRALAKRVSRMLEYYGLRVDDSSGQSMSELPAAVFLLLVLEVAQTDGAPVPLLSLLRHPLCQITGWEAAKIRSATRAIEYVLLRGVRPAGGMQGLLALAQANEKLPAEACALLISVADALAPLTALLRPDGYRESALATLLEKHLEAAQALGTEAIWAGHAGAKLSAVLAEIVQHAPMTGDIDPSFYSGVFSSLLRKEMYQPPYAGHPRLGIFSPMEARMQEADVVILGGLNEEVWPAAPVPDPWMNQAMRKSMGLPPLEYKIGQSAHDVTLLCMAEEVMLTRSNKRGNAPAIASRWWLRLQAVITEARMQASGRQWAHWGAALFATSQDPALTLQTPHACPPLEARPTEIFATRVETLMRDPYQFYASRILKLRPLLALDGELNVRDFGEAVHAAFEEYIKQFSTTQPADALQQLLAHGRQALLRHFHHPQVEAFWWPRFERIAQWYVGEERTRRAQGLTQVQAEQERERSLEVAGRTYLLRARIDRIEHYAEGGVLLVDYKTGEPPKVAEVYQGVACQMLIEAWILSASIPPHSLRQPEYWKTSGTSQEAKIRPIFGRKPREDYITHTAQELEALLAYFSLANTPYYVCPNPSLMPAYNDYAHLERRLEWMM